MPDSSQASLIINRARSSDPIVGETCFNSRNHCYEIYDGNEWKIIQSFQSISLTEKIEDLIENSEVEELKTLLQNFDKIKNDLEREFLSKC